MSKMRCRAASVSCLSGDVQKRLLCTGSLSLSLTYLVYPLYPSVRGTPRDREADGIFLLHIRAELHMDGRSKPALFSMLPGFSAKMPPQNKGKTKAQALLYKKQECSVIETKLVA